MSNFDLKKYLAENKLVKEQNITITHNDVAGDSKSTVVDVSLIDNLINSLQPIVGNKTIEIDNKMREDFIQTIVRRLTGYTDMGGGNVRINENFPLFKKEVTNFIKKAWYDGLHAGRTTSDSDNAAKKWEQFKNENNI
jgi:hypothetical protein